MSPSEAAQKQIEYYRRMTGEQRLKTALDLYELSCQISRDGIRHRYPEATPEFVEGKLHERIRIGYAIESSTKAWQ